MGFGIGSASAQNAAPNVARVSFVQGSVQLLAGQGTNFQQAVMNMPVLDGSRLQAGGDGQAEVEFGDGSVARLTPNSGIQFDHLGQDQVQLQQTAGLGYYELNVGDGHPLFTLQFAGMSVQPTANSIFRVGLDAGWEVAVISGSVSAQGDGIPVVNVAENQSIRAADNGAVAQGISGDSWDNWNQDRDQAIAQEASQQTPVRDDSANPQNENWNDLDADGNWYPVEGQGNVWVPAGRWSRLGSVWSRLLGLLSHLRLHLGFQLSLGLAALPLRRLELLLLRLGMGSRRLWTDWSPVIVVRAHPPGWTMPLRPPGGSHPISGRLVAVDRGPEARGPWTSTGPAPRPDHQAEVNLNGRPIAPVNRVDVRAQSFTAPKGTAPGTRAVLSGAPAGGFNRPSPSSAYTFGGNPPRAVQPPRPNVAYPPAGTYNSRSTYVAQPTPTTHYSAPPPPHYSAPPPAPHYSAPSGGGHR